mmetsp:Transcript_104641/g.239883  ORF Transcript_104641/g.239883 Transcript_104641/m.239883 type:complete len:230 (+) Transcript_104641:2381-3070(+)
MAICSMSNTRPSRLLTQSASVRTIRRFMRVSSVRAGAWLQMIRTPAACASDINFLNPFEADASKLSNRVQSKTTNRSRRYSGTHCWCSTSIMLRTKLVTDWEEAKNIKPFKWTTSNQLERMCWILFCTRGTRRASVAISPPRMGRPSMTDTLEYLTTKEIVVTSNPTATAFKIWSDKMNTDRITTTSNHSVRDRLCLDPQRFSATNPVPAKNNRLPIKTRGNQLICSMV